MIKVTDTNDDLANWLKDNKDAMLLAEDVDPQLLNLVISDGYADDLDR